MRLHAIAVLAGHLVLSAAAAALAGEPSTGILPLAGPEAHQLNPALGRAVAEQGLQAVLGPAEVQARLSADHQVSAALERAREAIALSREQELRMERDRAIRAAAEAISELVKVRASHHAPALTARAYVTLGLALQLRPVDDERTRWAFSQALRIDPSYQPPPGQLAPHLSALLEEARARSGGVQGPKDGDLAWLATKLGLARLVWLGVVEGRVSVLVFDARRGVVSQRIAGTVAPGGRLGAIAGLVSQALGGAPPPRELPRPPARRVRGRPWYRRWWVWTAVGAAVAVGAGVGIGLALRDEGSRSYDLHVHF